MQLQGEKMYTEIEIKNFWNKLKKEDFFEEANLEKTNIRKRHLHMVTKTK